MMVNVVSRRALPSLCQAVIASLVIGAGLVVSSANGALRNQYRMALELL